MQFKLRAGMINQIFTKSLKISLTSTKKTHGELVNILQVDTSQVYEMIPMFLQAAYTPLQVVIGISIVIYYNSYAAISAVIVAIIISFLNFFTGRYNAGLQKVQMAKKDIRLKYTTELFNNVKMIKMYGWDDQFKNQVLQYRTEELKLIRKRNIIWSFNIYFLWATPLFMTVAIFMTQVFIIDKDLDSTTVFTTIASITVLADPLRMLPLVINFGVNMFVSIKRIQDFIATDNVEPLPLTYSDQMNKSSENLQEVMDNQILSNYAIFFQDASFSLRKKESVEREIQVQQQEGQGDVEMVYQKYITLKNVDFKVKKGQFVAVIGSVGSGKSQLLSSLIGDLYLVNKTENTIVHLDPSQIAFCDGQAPWIQTATIQQNIQFVSWNQPEKYNKVTFDCALGPDFKALPAGDQTEVGEKGINLSGGQKSRVALARAVYASNKNIIIMDDPLSSLDMNSINHILKNSLASTLKDKTRILVTHHLDLLPQVDFIYVMHQGKIVESGTWEDLKNNPNSFFNQNLVTEFAQYEAEQSQQHEEIADVSKVKAEKLMTEEDRVYGRVSFQVYKQYFVYAGGFCLFILLIFVFIIWIVVRNGSDVFMRYWVDDESNIGAELGIAIYSILTLGSSFLMLLRTLMLTFIGYKAATLIHEDQLSCLLKSPINLFYDVTPIGRVLNRLSKDQTDIDGMLIFNIGTAGANLSIAIGAFIVCFIAIPWATLAAPFIMYLMWKFQIWFVNVARELQRMESISRSPIISLFSECLNGAKTIRAFQAARAMKQRMIQLIGSNIQPQFFFQAVAS